MHLSVFTTFFPQYLGFPVLVELVPTFSFAVCFMSARILATPPCAISPAAISDTQHRRCSCLVVCAICVGGLLQGKAWSCISQGSYAGNSWNENLLFGLYVRQLITIISDLVPSKKQTCSLIGGRQQQ